MSSQHSVQTYNQNKGTLVPGQSITINKYIVQVERYLSQGGFAHVYLVRTAAPVYNTTHHVLKRIAVANESMLSEVKKEVDVMRLLKGHPNIVHLIDAAWHRMPDGLYEVFILMEFCPGGGIIDMMNRRLRERLTEAEILQIFCDVCEGVACMHNLRPPLLHRDLKVENILQASPTSFKLCDFGSATPVAAKPPATTQEIRILEADLNRHTTLQYRAPEMVDVFSRRPVDEKSDVWALGVLLYKLCYYTTPFEEHGPLAILNVQYRIPPYPVYSPQMNALIGSMLREQGIHRPSVFELLAQVHQLRGTKSQFKYQIPSPQPPISPRQIRGSFPDNATKALRPIQPSLPNTRVPPPSEVNATPIKNAGVQAREKVLEAISPMRRGRPGTASAGPSRSSSPQKSSKPLPFVSDRSNGRREADFKEEEDKAWKAATTRTTTNVQGGIDDAWKVSALDLNKPANAAPSMGFGDDFGKKLWDSFDPSTQRSPSNSSPAQSLEPPPLGASLTQKSKDAFDGLGLMASSQTKAPTLAEARKLRTGLAIMSVAPNGSSKFHSPPPASTSYLAVASTKADSLNTPPVMKPSSSGSSWSSQPPKSRASPVPNTDGLPAESRFPSLEELDAQFGEPGPSTGRSKDLPTRPSDNKLSHSRGTTTSSREGSRPSLTRKHRSSLSIKSSPMDHTNDLSVLQSPAPPSVSPSLKKPGDYLPLPSRTSPVAARQAETNIRHPSPNKRTSQIEPSRVSDNVPSSSVSLSSDTISPTVSQFTRNFPALDNQTPSNLSPVLKKEEPARSSVADSVSSADEGPEEAVGYMPTSESKKPKRKGRQSSVHELVDLWGGGMISPTKEKDSLTPQLHKPAFIPASRPSTTDNALPQRLPGMATGPSHKAAAPESLPALTRKNSSQASVLPRSPTESVHSLESARSRPQSMFMFPTKSPEASSSSPISPDLLTSPPESRPRATRRTSISDMVHRFEAIGSSQKTTVSPTFYNNKSPITFPSAGGPTSQASALAPPKQENSIDNSWDRQPSPNGFARTSPVGLPRPIPSPVHRSEVTKDTEVNTTPRPRRISVKPDPGFPPRKPTVSETSTSSDARSPSPERPYRGVGRLIDQWQRKSEEANAGPPVRGVAGKRAGVVAGSGRT